MKNIGSLDCGIFPSDTLRDIGRRTGDRPDSLAWSALHYSLDKEIGILYIPVRMCVQERFRREREEH